VWFAFWIKSHENLMALKPDHAKLSVLGKAGVAAPLTSGHQGPAAQPPGENQPCLVVDSSNDVAATRLQSIPGIAVRAFAASLGVDEDPVTGSLNAALAQWLTGNASLPRHYQAFQGQALGREGLIDLRLDPSERLWVGGCSKLVIQGHMLFDAD
jgi:predicted PhzF superfamily epimerase YddE/YHI9